MIPMFLRLVFSTYQGQPGAVEDQKVKTHRVEVWWFTNIFPMILTAVSIVSEAGLLYLLANSEHSWALPRMCRGVIPFLWQWRPFYWHWGRPDSANWDCRSSGLYWLNHPHCEAQLSFDELELKFKGLWLDAWVSSLMTHPLLCFLSQSCRIKTCKGGLLFLTLKEEGEEA